VPRPLTPPGRRGGERRGDCAAHRAQQQPGWRGGVAPSARVLPSARPPPAAPGVAARRPSQAAGLRLLLVECRSLPGGNEEPRAPHLAQPGGGAHRGVPRAQHARAGRLPAAGYGVRAGRPVLGALVRAARWWRSTHRCLRSLLPGAGCVAGAWRSAGVSCWPRLFGLSTDASIGRGWAAKGGARLAPRWPTTPPGCGTSRLQLRGRLTQAQ
jgi:hypothetical protein